MLKFRIAHNLLRYCSLLTFIHPTLTDACLSSINKVVYYAHVNSPTLERLLLRVPALAIRPVPAHSSDQGGAIHAAS